MKRPAKPYPDFPLTPHPNGQWVKKVKGDLFYFGRWKEDSRGVNALADWLSRKDAIFAGLDKLRVAAVADDMTLGRLMGMFLESRRAAMLAKELSPTTYGDYLRELQSFVNTCGADAKAAALRPEHFAKYASDLRATRKLGLHARKRVTQYVKAMLNWGAGNGYFPAPTYGNEFAAPDTRPDAIRQAKARGGKKDFSKRIVSGVEIDQLYDRANPQFKAIILLGVNCGLGPADIGRLCWRHVCLDTGEMNMPRGKTGAERRGYLWKRTRTALARVAALKHNQAALARDGQEALVFWSRKAVPMYREREVVKDGVSVGVKIDNAISITFGRYARELKLEGVTHYRLRHTFKTLGKKAKDRDALNMMMGHREGTTGEVYDHEEIEIARIKRVAKVVHRKLWPKPKRVTVRGEESRKPMMRLVGGGGEAA
ncbi:MAG TPA: tyrosine-type recombinase/integrase [Tepidisphaeraceae bacterium]|jgi:integrase|nr:tyrosine-type recombinase/integrase [Tepidisphaeraceae bacterium]